MKKAEKSKDKKEALVVRTLQFKVRPQGYNFLNLAAIEINQIWNYCNEVSYRAIKPYFGKPKYLSGFDLNKLVASCTKSKKNPGFSNILADCVQLTAQEYAIRRNQFKKSKLRFRKSHGTNKSLGWIPLKRLSFQIKSGQKLKNGGVCFKGKSFPLYNFEYLRFNLDILKGKLKQGSFSQDKVGDWYFNVVCETPKENFEAWLFDLNQNSNQFKNIADILNQELGRGLNEQNKNEENNHPSLKDLIPGRKTPWNQIGREDVIGLDPGVASLATDSLGTVYEAFRGYRKAEEKLAKAQSLGDKQKVKFLSKKIKNSRRDCLHKLANEIVNSSQTIKIGKVDVKNWTGKKDKSKFKSDLIKNQISNQDLKIDIKDLVENTSKYTNKSSPILKLGENKESSNQGENNELTKTSTSLSISKDLKPKGLGHGKAVLDSGLGMLKTFLFYKGKYAGRRVVEVCEKYSTQMCSNCFELSGPKGEKDLNVRNWTCKNCGVFHQRDENAAVNISRIFEDLGLIESIKKWKEMHCKTLHSELFFEDDLNLTQMELKALLPRCRQIELNLKEQKGLISKKWERSLRLKK